MAAATPEPRTVRVDPERLEGWLTRFGDRHGPGTPQAAPDRLRLSAPDGAVAELLLRWGPLPDSPDPLAAVVAEFLRERTVGALLVRRKAHAVGVFEGPRLVVGRHDSHYVQGKTKAGGWSQQRYARRRGNQAGRAFAAAASDVEELLLPRLDSLEGLVLGGDGAAVRSVLSGPGFAGLRELAAASRHPVYPIADPNHSVLAGFPASFRAVPIQLNELC